MYVMRWELGRVIMTKNGEIIQKHFEELESLLELYYQKPVIATT